MSSSEQTIVLEAMSGISLFYHKGWQPYICSHFLHHLVIHTNLRRELREWHSKLGESRPLTTVDTDLFLTSIAENFSRVCYPLGSCFLRPGTHFIFILVEPIAAKDVTPYKGGWGDPHQFYTGGESIGVLRPPGSDEDVTWMVYPLGTGDVIAMAEELDRGCTEGSPTLRMPGVKLWFRNGVDHQGEAMVFCISVPGVPEVA